MPVFLKVRRSSHLAVAGALRVLCTAVVLILRGYRFDLYRVAQTYGKLIKEPGSDLTPSIWKLMALTGRGPRAPKPSLLRSFFITRDCMFGVECEIHFFNLKAGKML